MSDNNYMKQETKLYSEPHVAGGEPMPCPMTGCGAAMVPVMHPLAPGLAELPQWMCALHERPFYVGRYVPEGEG